MARVRPTEHAEMLMASYGISMHDIITIIGDYEAIEEDPFGSRFWRVSKVIRDKRIWVVYVARGENLFVADLGIEED